MYTKNTELLKTEVAKHIAADAVIAGHYWDGETGCFIGCLAHSGDATELERLYGLPLPLVRICERIFETLPDEERKAFFAEFPDAVERDGKDLSRVHWAFLAETLRQLPPVPEVIQAVIDTVIEGMDLLAKGEPWEAANVDSVAYVAYVANAVADSAAYAAADSAAYAARAHADAAHAARAHADAAYAARAAAYAAYAAAYAAYAAADAAYAAADAADAAVTERRRQRDSILELIRAA